MYFASLTKIIKDLRSQQTIPVCLRAFNRWRTHDLQVKTPKLGQHSSLLFGKKRGKEGKRKEGKTTFFSKNFFQKLIDWMNQSPFYNQRRQSQGSAKKRVVFIITWKLANQLYLEILVPYLYNLSEKVIPKSRQKEAKRNNENSN